MIHHIPVSTILLYLMLWGLTVMSNATIDSVQISDHNRMITRRSQISATHSETITIAGNEVSIKNYRF